MSNSNIHHMVLMGVCGSGKTTVAAIIADRLGRAYAEADDFHPEANVKKMASGHPLNDEDRWPWLEKIREWMDAEGKAGRSGIVTCSALKHSYRELLSQAEGRVTFVHLDGDKELIASRMAARTNHFMPTALLDSQLETLEDLTPDEDGFTIDISGTPSELADQIMERLGL